MQLETQQFLSMCQNEDLKKMLRRLKIPLTGMTRKAQYVQALLDSGWVQEYERDDEEDLPTDEDRHDLVVPARQDGEQRDEDVEQQEEEDDMEQESESEDDEDVDIDMEDRVFTSLPEISETYTDLIPDGWSIHGQLDSGGLPSLADRVLVYCWDNWSCGVVSTVYDRGMRRPACELSVPATRATVCVHWPSERSSNGDVPHSYFRLSKNNMYKPDDASKLQGLAWLLIRPDEDAAMPSNDE